MKGRIVLTNADADGDGLLVGFDADAASLAEIQAEIIKLVNSPRVKTLGDDEVEELIQEYESRGTTDRIRSLLYAAKAYWDEQGIEPGNTEDVIHEINRLHPDWKLHKETECKVFPVWM